MIDGRLPCWPRCDLITHLLGVILRTIAVVHCGFKEQVEQSLLLACSALRLPDKT